jgi:two-component system chemotaxis response regulator CheB
MPKIRVLVVDDAVVIRRMLTEVVERDPQLELAGVAANGRIALQKIPQVNPDVITLDVEMPEMDGITTLREIRKLWPKLPVIMCSTLTSKGASTTIEALQAGATDYVTKPANVGSVLEGFELMQNQLIPTIKGLCGHMLPEGTATLSRPAAGARPALPLRTARPAGATRKIEAICIGTSTGGPNALHTVFAAITQPFDVPLFVVQHMPPLFTAMLADRLGKCGPVPWHEGADGMLVEAGHAYIAPGGHHMEIVRDGTRMRVKIHDGPHENSCRPAVDVLFRSLVPLYGSGLLSVVMTGMGQDGLRGCQHIREVGGQVVVQDEASSVVWGMPGYIAQAGIADAIVPLQDIPLEMMRRAPSRRKGVA